MDFIGLKSDFHTISALSIDHLCKRVPMSSKKKEQQRKKQTF